MTIFPCGWYMLLIKIFVRLIITASLTSFSLSLSLSRTSPLVAFLYTG
mgnify:CR=1 FL=1